MIVSPAEAEGPANSSAATRAGNDFTKSRIVFIRNSFSKAVHFASFAHAQGVTQ
jgi:hypothetical protein